MFLTIQICLERTARGRPITKRMALMKMVMELQMKEPMVSIVVPHLIHLSMKAVSKKHRRHIPIHSVASRFAFVSMNQKVSKHGRCPCGIRLFHTKNVDENCVWKRQLMTDQLRRFCKIQSKNTQVSAGKLQASRVMPQIAGQYGVFHRQLSNVRGTSYCTILCRLRRSYVVI